MIINEAIKPKDGVIDEAKAQPDQLPTGGMTDEEVRTFISTEIQDALNYIDSEIAPDRELNYQYFLGEMPDVPPVDGRSGVVIRVIADYVGFMLPSLLRTVVSGKKVIEYVAKGIDDEDAAREATDYVNQVILRSDNNIEHIANGWGFDGLVNKVGVVKAYWVEKKDTEDFVYTVQSQDELMALGANLMQEGVEITGFTEAPGAIQVSARRTVDKSSIEIEVLPPEEFVISRDARSLENARLKSHRTYKYVGELIAEGYDPDKIMRLPSYNEWQNNQEAQIRQPMVEGFTQPSSDPMMRKVAVHYGTVMCDADGTGIKEWYFVAGGWQASIEILKFKPFEDEFYFADFCSVPLPHLFFGRCPADDLIEIQRVQTVLARQTMDNIYLTNSPQQEVVVQQLLGEDAGIPYVQNKSPGGLIPVKALGAVQSVSIPFMAGASLALMQYWDMQAENRTGSGRNSLGLDPEVLQNQSATAAKLQDSAAKLKMETIARNWASGGFRKLGRGILRIAKRHQNFARIVKMNGGMRQVDPRAWAELEDWDVTVNTGLGTGNKERDLQMGGIVISKMEEIIQKLGMNNPIVSLPMYSQALVKMVETIGFENGEQYFKPLPADWTPPEQPNEPPPEVQKEMIKSQTTMQKAEMDNAQKDQANASNNLVNYLLGVREQDIEAALERLKILRGKGDGNLQKVRGQRIN
jgi:hypothetical protein